MKNHNKFLLPAILFLTVGQSFAAYTSSCTVSPGAVDQHCDWGYNGNHKIYVIGTACGAGCTYVTPKMIFKSADEKPHPELSIRSTLSNGGGGEWTTSTGILDQSSVTLKEGENDNYLYNVYMTNTSNQTIEVKYVVCDFKQRYLFQNTGTWDCDGW